MPFGSEVGVIEIVGQTMVSEYDLLAVQPALSVTRTLKLAVPAAVGVPEITPPAERVNPAGNVPSDSDQVYGDMPPLAVSVWLYAVPTVPFGRNAGEIEIEGQTIAIE